MTLEPARYGKRKNGVPQCTRFAVEAWACAAHRNMTKDQPPPVKTPCTTGDRKPGADQMTIYDALSDEAA